MCGTYNVVEYYGKRIKILHGCPFEGWPNRAWSIQPISQFLTKRVGWPCPVRSALKKTPVQGFNSFSIMLYYIISTTYQKIGDLFYPVIFLDFCTVCPKSSILHPLNSNKRFQRRSQGQDLSWQLLPSPRTLQWLLWTSFESTPFDQLRFSQCF